ncbi:MAG: FAD synthetase family protein [Treponema sp.]|jgi:riboflavin kinase/FMN adenylyltransferase|nr:FAD synthetase family protein [Treponema sp.]
MDMSMRVIEWQGFITALSQEPAAMTVGVFDGVHRGHQALIERIVRRGPLPTVVTFRQNPKIMIRPHSYGGDIFSLRQKLAVFEQLGVARTILIDFTENFSKLKGLEFFDLLKKRGNLVFLAIGSNFRCGYRLDTHAADIKRMNERDGIPTEVIHPVQEAGCPVSSSRIRSVITAGDLAGAAVFLGRKAELDLADISAGAYSREKERGTVFDLFSRHRITPPDGRYGVILYGRDAPGGVKTEIFLEKGKVFVSAPFNAERLEFI